jgi:hypothetical protein
MSRRNGGEQWGQLIGVPSLNIHIGLTIMYQILDDIQMSL